MKKKIILVLIVLLLIIAIVVGYVIFKKFTLNDSEKEVLSVLQDLDNSLKSPTAETTDGNNTTFSLKPTSATSAKELINHIHEVRKVHNDKNGGLAFLFKVSILDKDNNEMESILCVTNGKLTSMTLDDKLSEFLNINKNDLEDNMFSGIYSNLIKSGIEASNKAINKLWDEGTSIKNINLNKIFNNL